MVAKGFTQVPGIDFGETYAPVTHLESVHTVLHLRATNDWDIDHLDVKTAFLHGQLDEEIYMEQPEGAKEPGKEDWICHCRAWLGVRLQNRPTCVPPLLPSR